MITDGLKQFLDKPGKLVAAATKGIIIGSLMGAGALPVLTAAVGGSALTVALAQLVGSAGVDLVAARVQKLFDKWLGQPEHSRDHDEFARQIEDDARRDPQFAAHLVQMVQRLDLPAHTVRMGADDFATVYAAMQHELGALQARLDDASRATAERILAGFKAHFDTLVTANKITHAKLNQIIAMLVDQEEAEAERKRVVKHPIPDVSRTVGRIVQLKELRDRLRHNKRLAIVGVAGVGKSTLAAMYCTDRNYRGNYLVVCWFEMKGQPLVSDLARRFGALVGRQPSDQTMSEEDYARELLEWLHDLNGQHLIVLNNAESVLDENNNATGGWSILLGDARLGSNRLLLTSRQQVRAGGEMLSAYKLGGLSEDEAVALLTAREVVASDAELREAAKKCECHTYALIFLAQLVVGGRKLTRLLQSKQSKKLWQGEIAVNLLDEVYHSLSIGQQAMLGYVSVFDVPDLLNQPVSAAEMAAMLRELDIPLRPTPAENWDADGVDALGLALTRRSLLEYSADERYTTHAIVRDYAYKELPDPAAHHRAAAASYRRQYIAAHPDPHTDPPRAMDEVQPLLDAFDQLCAAGDFEDAAIVMIGTTLEYMSGGGWISLNDLLLRWGEFSRLVTLLERIVNAPSNALGDSSHGHVLGNLGIAYLWSGDYQQAIIYYKRSLAIFEQLGDLQGKGNQLGNLGHGYLSLGEYQQAKDYSQQALIIAEQIGDLQGEGKALGNLGIAYREMGEHQQAIAHYHQALAIFEQIGDIQDKGRRIGNLGNVYRDIGEYQQAIGYYQQALNISTQIDDRAGVGRHWNNLGEAYECLKQYREALGCFLKALSIRESLGNPVNIATTKGNIEDIRAAAGQQDWPALEAEAQRLAADPNWRPWQDDQPKSEGG